MRANIVRPPVYKPPNPNQNGEPNSNNASVIHSDGIGRKGVREAIDDNGDDDVDARDSINEESGTAHPEWPRLDVLPPGKEMW